jgi:hypothetical protein
LQKELEATKSQVSDLEKGYASRLERMEAALAAKAEADAETKAAQLAEKMRAAAEVGDLEQFDTAFKEYETPKAPESAVPEAEKQAIEAWIPQNPWFHDDPVAGQEASQYYSAYTARGMTPGEALEKTTERIALKHPYLFPKPEPKPQAAAVDGGGLPGRKSGKKGWGDMPAEDRAMVKRQIEDGQWNRLAEQMKTTPREAFAAAYWEQP